MIQYSWEKEGRYSLFYFFFVFEIVKAKKHSTTGDFFLCVHAFIHGAGDIVICLTFVGCVSESTLPQQNRPAFLRSLPCLSHIGLLPINHLTDEAPAGTHT